MPEAAEREARTDVAYKGDDGKLSPLYRETTYKQFPVRRYSPVGIIAYHFAKIPKDPQFAKGDTTPEPSVRFLFLSTTDPELRKWSNWMPVKYTYSPNASKLVKFFDKIPGLGSLVTSNKWLFNTPFEIDCSADGEYVNIDKAITAEHDVSHLFYDVKFVPYKTVKAFKHIVTLELAVIKAPDGIITLENKDMIEPEDMSKLKVEPA